MILVKKYHIVQRTAQCRVFCCRVHLHSDGTIPQAATKLSFQHRPETIGLIIAAMMDVKEADAPFVLQSTKSKGTLLRKRSGKSTP